MLQIRLLGQFDLRADGKRILIASRSGQSLFAFLALHAGAEHRREKLAGMIWPDSPDELARKNLRQELWRIRKAIMTQLPAQSTYITADDFMVTFDANAPHWLDVAALEKTQDDIEALSSNLSLYRGELLAGFYDEWVMLERDRVQGMFENKCGVLLENLIQAERWKQVQEWAERWIALGQTPEPAYRALMMAAAAQGDSAKLALAYERCVEALKNDLGVEPSSETRALFEELSQGKQTTQTLLTPISPILIQPSGTVTFLFSDIEGSTKLLERLGDEYANLLGDQRDLLRAIAEKHAGHEVDTQGDSFFFAFFRAADAVHFAADSQRALASHSVPRGETLRVRMGLHTGEPMLARTGYVGIDVHRAARIGAAGHGGQVLLSESTRALVENELPQGTQLKDLGEHRLKDLRYPVHIVQLAIEGLPADFRPLKSFGVADEPPAPGEPPFKGLEYFDVDDANLFFGREELVAKLADSVRANRFLAVVVGASGSGKSSIVRAGLIPALRGSGDGGQGTGYHWRVIVMTPTAHPLEALAIALTRDAESVTTTATLMDDLAREPRSLHLFLRRMRESLAIPKDERQKDDLGPSSFVIRPLLIVDQFEELFTLCRDDLEREQFIDNLLYALGRGDGLSSPSGIGQAQGIAPTLSFTLVLTLRADFYSHLAQYPELRDAVAKQQEYIGPMNMDELRRAIQEPAKQGNWEFEPGLVDLILRDVGEEPGALPLLSHALLETWKRRSGHRMTLKGYHDAGGVRGAIAHTAESTYQQLTPAQQNIARNIFLRLTELGEGTEDTRRRAEIREFEIGDARPSDSVTPQDGRASVDSERAQVREVLTLLADARLITTHEHTAEVAHEALIREWARLREWLNENRDGLKLHRQLTEAAHEWALMERDASTLYRGARLAAALEFANTTTNVLNEQEHAFLEASEENEKREAREREEQRERELLAAQKLAQEQHARAEIEMKRAAEQTRANKRLRQRALFLAGAFVLALVLAGVALFLGNRANENAVAAAQNAQAAGKARDESQVQQRIANSRAFAAYALNNLNLDPQRSILLALQAVKATEPDNTVLPEAQDALHRAVIASHVQASLPFYSSPDKAPPPDVYRTFSASFSPDGSRIAMRGPGVFRVLDAKTHQELLNLPVSPDFGAVGLGYNADGTQVATIDHDASKDEILVKIFDANSGKLVRETRAAQKWEYIFAAGFSPDLNRVVLMPYDGPIHVWDTTTGQSVATLPITNGGNLFPSVTFSPDGKRMATATSDSATHIFDAATGKELMKLCCHGATVAHAAFSPDGKYIASAGWDFRVKVWDAVTGKELNSLAGHSNVMTDVTWSPDSKRLASTSWDRKAIVWDAENGKLIYELPGHLDFVKDAEFSPNGKTLVTASDDGTAMLWDIGPSRELVAIEGTEVLFPAGYNGDRTRMFTFDGFDEKGTLKIWDMKTLDTRQSQPLGRTFNGLGQVALSPDEKIAAFTIFNPDDNSTSLGVWDLNSGKQVHSLAIGKADFINSPKFSPDGKRLAATLDSDRGMQIAVWNATAGEIVATLNLGPIADTYVETLAWSPDGKRLLTGYANGLVQAWDANTGAHLFDMPGHTNYIWQIVYSPDGSKIATASRDGIAIVYEAETGKELIRLIGHTSTVDSLDWSPDGKYIVTAGSDGTAKLWDAENGTELATFNQGSYPVEGAIFTADGKHIITTSDDGALREFTLDVNELVQLATARLIRP